MAAFRKWTLESPEPQEMETSEGHEPQKLHLNLAPGRSLGFANDLPLGFLVSCGKGVGGLLESRQLGGNNFVLVASPQWIAAL